MSQELTPEKSQDLFAALLSLAETLMGRKRFILVFTLLATVGAAAYSLTLPNIYTASATVLPPQKEGASLPVLGGQAALLAGMGGSASELYIGILNSRSVSNAVIKRLDLVKHYHSKSEDQARLVLASSMKSGTGKDGFIRVTVEDRDPKMVAQIANTFVDELMRTSVRLNLSKAGAERAFLEKRLEITRQDLKNADTRFRTFIQKNKGVQLDASDKASAGGIVSLKAQLVNKEMELAVLRNSQTDENPTVKAVKSTIGKLQQEIALNTGSEGAEGVRLLRELKIQEALFEQLAKQYEMAKLTEAKDTSSLQILDSATPPTFKSKPKRTTLVIFTMLVAFIVSVLWVLTVNFYVNISKNSREQIARFGRNKFC